MFNSAGKSGIFKNEKWEPHPLSDKIEAQSFQLNDLIYDAKFGNNGSLFLQSGFRILIAQSPQKSLTLHRQRYPQSEWEIKVIELEGKLLVHSPIPEEDSKFKSDKSYKISFGEEPENLSSFKITPGFRQNQRFYALKTDSGKVLSAFEYLVGKSDKNNWITRRLPSEIMNLKKGPDGQIWVATQHNGIYFFDNGLNKLDSTLPGKAVDDILFDKMGGVWVSTLNEGIFYLPGISVRIFNSIKPSPNNNLRLNPLGKDLVISHNNAILIYGQGYLQKLSLPVPENFAPTGLFPFNNGYYLGSKQGLIWLDSAFQVKNSILSVKSGGVVYARDICQHEGSVYFAGRKGFSKVVNNKAEELVVSPGFSYGLQSFAGFLWMATSNGLQAYSVKSSGIQHMKLLFNGFEITKIKVDAHGLWAVVSGKGIFLLNDRFQARLVSGLMRFSGIRDFVLTPDSQMIVAGGSGLLKGRLRNDLSFLAEHHIYSQTVNQVVQFKNQIWFISRTGVLYFPLGKNSENQIFPLLLHNVSVNGKPRMSRFPAIFSPGENNLTFRFDLLNFYTPQSRLSFQLTGKEIQEGLVNGNEIVFQNLNPGKYRLNVSGEGFFGERLSAVYNLDFEIKPAFWQTWWFQLVALGALIVLITLSIWYIFKIYRNRDLEKNRINQLLASYKLRALQSQMNPHFVSNALTAIQQLILTKEHLKANQYLTKFSRLLRLVLSFSEKPFIPLSGELNLIKLNVDLESLRFGNRFSFSMEISDEVQVEKILIPSLITQPFIENAIWHGLIPLETGHNALLEMKIYKDNNVLKINIADNGIGRKASQAKKLMGHESMGLKLSMDRLQNLNNLMKDTLATVAVTDRTENEKNCGTLVIISLPLNIHSYHIEGLPD